MRRRWSGCAAVGCAAPLITLFILLGAVGTLAGNWAGLARPSVPSSAAAAADIPPAYLVLYQQAAARFGLPWPVLAAIGELGTDHGRDAAGCAPDAAGARGPMAFPEAAFADAATLAGLASPDICDPADAIPAAAAYLVSNGAPADWQRALSRYNPADGYPAAVIRWAQRYGDGALVRWPLEGPLTQGFGPTTFTVEPPRCIEGQCYAHFHDGIDIAAPLGSPVRAVATGRVVLAGRLSDGAVVVEIEHRPNVLSFYGHLDPTLTVREGDAVVAGQVVGAVGLTGTTTGPHLHFAIYASGVPLDPLRILPVRP